MHKKFFFEMGSNVKYKEKENPQKDKNDQKNKSKIQYERTKGI